MGDFTPAFPSPLHVGRPNVGDVSAFTDMLGDMFDRRWFTNDGPFVRELEEEISARLGVRNVVAMSHGTSALELLIQALGINGEVILPAFTFVATVHAVERSGARPVFADIDERTHNLNPESVRKLVTPRTSAILGVHLWGRPAPIEDLQQIADEHDLTLIFDAAHAFSVSTAAGTIGAFGRAEVFSFHSTKFFNTFEGGAVATNDDELAAKLRLMRNFGFSGADSVVHLGTNAKMPEVCAAMGRANLRSIDDFIRVNRRNFAAYQSELRGSPGVRLHETVPAGVAGNFQYVVALVHHGRRDAVLSALQRNNVLARRYFWPGCHRMEPYRSRWEATSHDLTSTEKVAGEVLVLPTGTSIEPEQIATICAIIRDSLQ